MKKISARADSTPEQIAFGKKWVEIWKFAAVDLERIKRKETPITQTSVRTKTVVGVSGTPTIVQKGS